MTSLFGRGPDSLRVPSEHQRLFWTIVFLAPVLAVLGIFFQNTFTMRSLVLLLVGAMVFVALSRGRLLGGGVRIGPGQFEHIHAIVLECAKLIGIPPPHVFLRDDPFVPIVAVGTADPYSLVFSSQYVEAFTDDELRFLVGRELGHVAAGHAKLTSLLSVNGRENAFVAAVFGAWLRFIEYSADRVGLLCCGSLATALSAIAVSTFHHAGRKIDLHAFAEQRREIDAESSLRLGEWLGATPYATSRIAKLGDFARDPLYLRWSSWFMERRAAPPPSAMPLGEDDARRFAGPWRRLAAFVIDFFVVMTIVPDQQSDEKSADDRPAVDITTNGVHVGTVPASGVHVNVVHHSLSNTLVHLAVGSGFQTAAFIVYVLLLTGLVGQTLGMIILDLRVVCIGRSRIGWRDVIWRYLCLAVSFLAIVGIPGLFARIQPFERWSRTRLINGGATRS